MPHAGASEGSATIDVEVESGRVGIFSQLVPELDADEGLVRGLILREPRVSVDSEHRTADRPRIRPEVFAQRLQVGPEVGDEPDGGIPDVILVAVFILVEPLPCVVFREVLQEGERRLREVGHGLSGVEGFHAPRLSHIIDDFFERERGHRVEMLADGVPEKATYQGGRVVQIPIHEGLRSKDYSENVVQGGLQN